MVTEDGVNQLSRDDAVTIEGLSIGEVRGGYACVRGRIVPSSFPQSLPRPLFQFLRVCETA